MPVGCLGGGSASNNGGLAKPMDVIVTSTVLNAAFISPFWALFNQNLSLFQGLKMPVGCLGSGSASNNGGLAKTIDVIVTSTVLNAAFISPFWALFESKFVFITGIENFGHF